MRFRCIEGVCKSRVGRGKCEGSEGFWGIWEGVRNRKGYGCVWGSGVFGERIQKGGDDDVLGSMRCVGGE